LQGQAVPELKSNDAAVLEPRQFIQQSAERLFQFDEVIAAGKILWAVVAVKFCNSHNPLAMIKLWVPGAHWHILDPPKLVLAHDLK
jgi:hypothetical protein